MLILPQNYVADWTMSFLWGAVVGTNTIIPYFYSVFFITVLIHRTSRDFERSVCCSSLLLHTWTLTCFFLRVRCAVKYGKDWEKYCQVVKWKFIPGIY